MSERLATAVEELRAEETRIQTDIDALRRQVKSGETQLKQIQRALSVLVEKPRGKSANQKSAATRQEVIAAMTEILGNTGSIEEAELKQLVADKIASLGKSRIGLALRFTEALNKGRFIRGEDGMISVNAKAVSV
jgi:predicted  nucleic acid-binding Zn-ribbon protein